MIRSVPFDAYFSVTITGIMIMVFEGSIKPLTYYNRIGVLRNPF